VRAVRPIIKEVAKYCCMEVRAWSVSADQFVVAQDRGDRFEQLNADGTRLKGDCRAPAFPRFVMIRPIQSTRPRSGEHCFCASQGAAGSSTTIPTYVS
jgi:hypothetical protein